MINICSTKQRRVRMHTRTHIRARTRRRINALNSIYIIYYIYKLVRGADILYIYIYIYMIHTRTHTTFVNGVKYPRIRCCGKIIIKEGIRVFETPFL